MVGALVVGVLLLAACGGESGDDPEAATDETAVESTTSSPEVDVDAAVTAYTECLRGNGIDIDDPSVDENGNLVPATPPGLGPQPGGVQPDAPSPGQASDPGQAPDPGDAPGGGSVPDDGMIAALQECSTLLNGTEYEVAGGFGGPGGDFEEAFAELSACLAEQGIELEQPDVDAQPDTTGLPDSDGGPGQFGPGGAFGRLDLEDPDVQAAMEVCGDLLPNFGSGGPGGPPTTEQG